ncbi:MAG: ferrochelatase [Ornithinimicrobium sp.]|uniref:ferrochelatase n=1 Tax=Ornithinimicrobium sp. TaxID=1977084 RepID=UPI003D9B312A
MTSPPADPVDPRDALEPVDPVLDPEPATNLTDETSPYDAIVLVSFGGPESPDEVMPFLRRVTGGRGIPDERLAEVAEHYHHFGGRSPINDQNRALLEALRAELDRRGIPTPVLWGNRNCAPFLTDTLREADAAGRSCVVAVTTSAYSCYSSCRQYREDLATAVEELRLEGGTLHVDKVRQYWNHPGFAAVNVRLVTDAVREVQASTGELPRIVCVTHSIPDPMDDTSGSGEDEGNLYSAQHAALTQAIAEEVSVTLDQQVRADLAYCSRSGPPSQPWLEPDVNDHLRALHADGVRHVVVAPIGFVSDHMEVVFDLDTEARETADELGLGMVRVPTVGIDPEFVSGLVDLVLERAGEARGDDVERPAWPVPQARPSTCRPGCCPNLRVAKPALCGMD